MSYSGINGDEGVVRGWSVPSVPDAIKNIPFDQLNEAREMLASLRDGVQEKSSV